MRLNQSMLVVMDEVDEVDDEADVAEAHSRPSITEAKVQLKASSNR